MEKRSKLRVIIDVGNSTCDGKLYDRDFLNDISHTLLPIHELAMKLKKIGIDCLTPDQYLVDDNNEALLISHLVSDRTDQMVIKGATPFLLLVQESPFIATRFYLQFKSISKRFVHTMAFSGLRKRAAVNTDFVDMHFPIYHVDQAATWSTIPFQNRRTAVLVAGNKRAHVLKSLPIKILYGRLVKLIYPWRKRVIAYLAAHGSLDIFGRNWEHEADANIQKACQGTLPADAKLRTLGSYKFTLCFENAIFPGYLTEKIFDAMLAGTIPIYLGDPYIEHLIPKNTFLDVRDFRDLDDLFQRIQTIDEPEFDHYLTNIKNFLNSPAFQLFSHQSFVDQITDMIIKYERN